MPIIAPVAKGPLTLAALAMLLVGCGHSGSTSTVIVTAPASAPASSAPAPGSPSPGTRPSIVAVTAAGALVVLDSSTGAVVRTLVPGGVLGDEVSVSPDGATVYFAQGSAACDRQIESVSIGGGTPAPIAPGILPAVSPDGTKLAFAQEPVESPDCTAGLSHLGKRFKLVIRTLSSGTERVLPAPPAFSQSIPAPISHLSWAADGRRLAVTIGPVQDIGYGLFITDTAVSRFYLSSGPGAAVPVGGKPHTAVSFIREGVFLTNGDLFISRVCCGTSSLSRLMWEVAPDGAFVHQVAIGYPNLDHVSLAVSPSGRWLLYLAGHDLYVSDGGNRPVLLTRGFIAAAWA